MLRVRRVVTAFVAAAPVAALLAAGPAQAAVPPDAATACTLNGIANITGGTPGAYVAVQGGSGTYRFNNTLIFNCVTSNNKVTPPSVDVEQLTVTSNGSFANTVCGTGTADSTNAQNTVTAVKLAGPGDNTALWNTGPAYGQHLGYHIQFAGGQGALLFTDPAVTGAGPISISPNWSATNLPLQGGANQNYCTNSFEVTGSVDGAFNLG